MEEKWKQNKIKFFFKVKQINKKNKVRVKKFRTDIFTKKTF